MLTKYACCALLLLATGCTAIPVMNTERQIAMQAGLESAIQFNTTGEPTDIPGSFDQTLTLADATEMALRHDPRVQAALARVRIAEADATQNRLLPNPILSVVVRFPSGGGNPQIDAGLSAELLALLQRPRQISAADQRLRASSANALDVALDVVLETQERYAGVQASLAKERSLQAQQSLIGKLGEITQSRVEAGEASRGDQLSVVNEQLALDADLLRSNATLRDQQLQLARLIGKPSSDIQIAVVEWRAPDTIETGEAEWIQRGLAHRPDLLAAQWELIALGDEAQMQSLALLDGAGASIEAERDDGWSVGPGASVPLPIFDWGDARRSSAEARVIEGRHLLVLARRQAVEEIRRALAELTSTRTLLDQLEQHRIPRLQEHLDLLQSAYEIGEADMVELILAQQRVEEAQAERIELQLNLTLANDRLVRSTGGQSPDREQP